MAAKKNGYWNRRKNAKKSGPKPEPNWNAWFADLEDTLPNLRQFLVGMPVGEERIEGGSVLVFADYETPKLRLSDRHYGEVAFHAGETLEEMLQAIDAKLGDDSVPWRIDQYSASRRKGGKR